MATYPQNYNLQDSVQHLITHFVHEFNRSHNDLVTLKTLKYYLILKLANELGLSFKGLINLLKTHIPVHPTIIEEILAVEGLDEDMKETISQILVRNEKAHRIMKHVAQQGVNVNQMLAIDGLAGNKPNFEMKHYINNLRFGYKEDLPTEFDEEPEFKRHHVQTIREIHKMIGNSPAAAHHVYEIVRKSLEEMVQVKLPELEYEEKGQLGDLEGKCGSYYMQSMGRANIESLVKNLRFKGEKRIATETEENPEKIRKTSEDENENGN